MAESARQKRITGRVMHEFKHGELKSGPGGKGGPVKSRKQAIAIALEEAGDSKYESEGRNKRNLHRTEKKEAEGTTGQQEREGKSRVGASGKDGSLAEELWREFDESLVDEHSDRIQIRGVRLQPESLRFERNGSPTCKRIEDRRRVAVRGPEDLSPGLLQQARVGGGVPLDEPRQQRMESLPLRPLEFLSRKFLGPS